ncbi:MAG: geranylgeranylglyceryl/heptaprenylglyceryl phosphate synthase [candidate division WOR-3 bacterium]|nr:MAG: geranylgeranylglyceryl/heptaprenylglyceryl phosphate synthase [candidate division WOR-3 bacterium]
MNSRSIYDQLNSIKPGVLALLDPDRMSTADAGTVTKFVCDNGVKGILIGSSLLVTPHFDKFVQAVSSNANCPVILFPGGSHQVCSSADAIFFLSLLSGRNSEFLIGEQVKAVFLIKECGLEVIPVGYILVESGNFTAVEYISNTKPIPRAKPEIAVAHALAGQYFGMKYIYLEAGSGAANPVPHTMVQKVRQNTNIPLIVGGGLREYDDVRKTIDGGADFVVMGSIIERSENKFKDIMRRLR